jgi:hypothetical protein
MGLPPMIKRVTSCDPNLIVGNRGRGLGGVLAAGALRRMFDNTNAPAARPAVCLRNLRRVAVAEANPGRSGITWGFIWTNFHEVLGKFNFSTHLPLPTKRNTPVLTPG